METHDEDATTGGDPKPGAGAADAAADPVQPTLPVPESAPPSPGEVPVDGPSPWYPLPPETSPDLTPLWAWVAPPPSEPADVPLLPPPPRVGRDPFPGLQPSPDPANYRPLFSEPANDEWPPPVAPPPTGKSRTFMVAVLAGLIGAGLALAGFLIFDNDAPTGTAIDTTPRVIREQVRTEFVGDTAAEADAAVVARKVIPSVVNVQIGSGTDLDFIPTGSGSGVVFTEDGYIVTNNHVIDGAESIQVIFSDGRIYDATVVGTDPRTDVAVIKIAASGLIPIEIGSSKDLEIGVTAIAAGNPLGLMGGPSLTVGVISAFDREVQTGPSDVDHLFGMLQTDAPITRGSSGGALVDGTGKLIGITTAVGVSDVGVEGVGFAIPVEVVNRVARDIIADGTVTHSFLGIGGVTLFGQLDDGARYPRGVTVQSFESDSAAQVAGMAEGDIITEVNGEATVTIESLIVRLRQYSVGETVDVTVERNGRTMVIAVTLRDRPEPS